MAGEREECGELLQAVVFAVEGRSLGMDIRQVQEVLRMVEVTPFPRMPDFALGAINLRGRVVPVINLRRKLGLPDRPPGPETRVLVARSGGQLIGFLVDAVSEVLDIPAALVESAGEGPAWMRSEPVAGLGKIPGRLLVLIDPARLLTAQEESLLPRDGVPAGG
ncbi:MAG TPA: chemotaxis protein CheW [Candidatus Methanoperedens sp.]|nr:chemotaxis protein CheW [Candidatus Methanoperedens sp.]